MPGHGHPLLLAAGEFPRAMPEAGAQIDVLITRSSQAGSSDRPAMSAGRVMFSRAVRVGSRLKEWGR